MKIRELYGIISLIAALLGLAILLVEFVIGTFNRYNAIASLVALLSIIMGSLSLHYKHHTAISIIGIVVALYLLANAAYYLITYWILGSPW
jgi:hypothetical protein